MPENDLSLRAEQALLGAILRQPRYLVEVDYLSSAAFTRPTYQAIYQSLREVILAQTGPSPERLPESIALQVRIPGVTADYLRSLAAACPEPEHATIYARMIQESHVRTTLAGLATNLARDDIGFGQDDQHYNEALKRALTRQNHLLTGSAHEELVPAIASRTPAPEAAYQPSSGERVRREELILADLLQHQEQIVEVQTWLSPELFAAGPRRELYETIVTIDGYGEPVTELTVEWELSRRRALEPAGLPASVQDSGNSRRPEAEPDYLARLMATAVAVGAAVEIGTELLTEVVRNDLAQRAAATLANVRLNQGAETQHAVIRPLAGDTAALDPAKQQVQQAASAPQLLQPPPTSAPSPNQPKPRM